VTDTNDPGRRAHQEDELLVIRCQLGERPAFEELVERWHPPVWKYIRRVAGDDDAAWDVAQDVWLRVLRGIVRLRAAASLRPWLFGIARRALMDRLRHQYAAPIDADVDLAELVADTSSDASEEEIAAMERELARLPVIEREVLTLFYLRELSLTEVADVLGVPVGTVKSRLFRARRQLRHGLNTEGESA
jgi:RNA polymerase sigma factor (sigma-70 family)